MAPSSKATDAQNIPVSSTGSIEAEQIHSIPNPVHTPLSAKAAAETTTTPQSLDSGELNEFEVLSNEELIPNSSSPIHKQEAAAPAKLNPATPALDPSAS